MLPPNSLFLKMFYYLSNIFVMYTLATQSQSSLRASMMRRNNLGLLEKNCATKNVIWENCFNWRLFWSHGLEQAVASPPSWVNSVLTIRKLWGGLPQHSVICAVFSRIFIIIIIIIINHHHHHIIIIISYHHIGQIYYVLRWKKKGAENTSISEYFGLVKF